MSTFLEKLKAHPEMWAEHKLFARAEAAARVAKAVHELKVAARKLREIEEDDKRIIDALDSLLEPTKT